MPSIIQQGKIGATTGSTISIVVAAAIDSLVVVVVQGTATYTTILAIALAPSPFSYRPVLLEVLRLSSHFSSFSTILSREGAVSFPTILSLSLANMHHSLHLFIKSVIGNISFIFLHAI